MWHNANVQYVVVARRAKDSVRELQSLAPRAGSPGLGLIACALCLCSLFAELEQVTSLSRIDRVIWDMATDDINRSPDVLPHTKLRVKVSSLLGACCFPL